MKNAGLTATLGGAPRNRGGKHGGINPAGGECDYSHTTPGQRAGNPGTELPWEGADATPKPGELPPLTHLGGSGGHDLNPPHR